MIRAVRRRKVDVEQIEEGLVAIDAAAPARTAHNDRPHLFGLHRPMEPVAVHKRAAAQLQALHLVRRLRVGATNRQVGACTPYVYDSQVRT